jgi:hypothetical protein
MVMMFWNDVLFSPTIACAQSEWVCAQLGAQPLFGGLTAYGPLRYARQN